MELRSGAVQKAHVSQRALLLRRGEEQKVHIFIGVFFARPLLSPFAALVILVSAVWPRHITRPGPGLIRHVSTAARAWGSMSNVDINTMIYMMAMLHIVHPSPGLIRHVSTAARAWAA
eukprot:1158034-Pelagomonas_calceolata.AAC.7